MEPAILVQGHARGFMNRYTRPLDGALPLAANLYEDEEVVASQDGVGLYDA